MSMFQKATRQQVPLKLGITGPSGSGKTTAALRCMRGLVGPEGRIAFCDTENGSASLYAHLTDFDVVNMNPPYQVAKFLAVIKAAEEGGYAGLIIDTGSAEWQELLAEKEALDARGGNSFANWGAITKKHEDFLKAVRNARIHIILCLRAKQEHVQDKDASGKTTVRKVGMAAIQREGAEYELTTVFDIAMDHNAKASKDRTGLFDGRLEPVTEETGREIAAWLATGAVPIPDPTPAPAPATAPQGTATPAAPAAARATAPRAQGAAQPVAQGAKAPTPTQAAPKAPTASSAGTNTSTGATSQPISEPPAEFVTAMVELAEVSVGLDEKTRKALIADFEKEGPASLPAVREEIAKLRFILHPETIPTTPGGVIAQMDRPEAQPVSQLASDFVDGLDPLPTYDTDEAGGGISAVQYEALNQFIGAYKIDRDCLRSYMAKAGHLLPGKNGPTLARMKSEEFAKLRDKLCNQKIASGKETWSQRTVRIINTTPITTYSPVSAAS